MGIELTEEVCEKDTAKEGFALKTEAERNDTSGSGMAQSL